MDIQAVRVDPQVPATDQDQQLAQDRPLKKGDRVTFFNDRINRWMTAKTTSGANKYYKKQGPYHNFVADSGEKGGHYFHPSGLWSLLDDVNQMEQQEENTLFTPPEADPADFSFFIDDEYEDQEDLSLEQETFPVSDPLVLGLYPPSAASFPDLDVQQPVLSFQRPRFSSLSEPDLPTLGCHESLRLRLRRWGSALREAWVSTASLPTTYQDCEGGGEEMKEAATYL